MDKHDDYMTTSKMEAFGEATTLAFSRNGDPKKGAAYLNFISERLRIATPEESKYIDTNYTEVLFFGATEKAIDIGWPLVPQNLKDLYIKFHGYPPAEINRIRKHR
jgi:hypothetical protein